MEKKENLTIHDCLNHDEIPSFEVDPIIEQQRKKMEKEIDESTFEMASALVISVGELLDRYRPRVEFLPENKEEKRFCFTMRVWFEPTQP